MVTKVILSVPGNLSAEAVSAQKAKVADFLGCCATDVLVLTGCVSVQVLSLPDKPPAPPLPTTGRGHKGKDE